MTSRPAERPEPQYVFLERPRCPECGGTDLKTLRSIRTDDAQRRTTVCRDCGTRFFIVVE